MLGHETAVWKPTAVPNASLCHTGTLMCVLTYAIQLSGLCCAAHIPWPKENLRQDVVKEEHVRSSYLLLASMPPAWPCLYLKVHQEHPT